MHRKHNKLLPVGGHIELNETPWQAIAHELTEESGYTLDELSILQPRVRLDNLEDLVVHPCPVMSNTHRISDEHAHSDTSYAMIATDAPKGSVHDGESTDLRWMTLAEMAALPEGVIWPNTQRVYEFMISTLLNDWVSVPATSFSLASPHDV